MAQFSKQVLANKGSKFQCDQCESSYRSPSELKGHKEAVHDGLKYIADKCPMINKKCENLITI